MSIRPPRRLALATACLLAVAACAPPLALATTPLTGVSTQTVTTASSAATTTTTVTTATPTSSSTSGGLSTLDVAGIVVVALIIFGTIIYMIRSDARSHTPSGDGTLAIDRQRGTVTPAATRIKRSRARAKAARRARRAGR